MRAPIAIFDDDATLRELLRDVLEVEGCSVVVCSSLMELHQAAVRGAMLAIVDGWGSGHLTLGYIERQQIIDLARLVPTVLMSGRTWAAKVTAGELGLVALLPKPFDLQALLDIVRARQRVDDHTPTGLALAMPSPQAVGQPV
jgi:DNA-binding response OmpR family regulator